MKNIEEKIVTAIGFDEQKDKLKFILGLRLKGATCCEFEKEEHCVVILWAGML